MRKGLFTLLSLVCAGLIWAAPAPANAADKIVIRFAHSNTPSDMDPYHALVTKMSDKLVKKLGADRIEIQEFPAGQIGSEERSFQDVQQGILQMTVLAVNNASIFAPSLGAFDLPYIFKSVKEFDDCVDQNWDLINKRMEAESGTVAIAWHSQGFRFITNSKQPVSHAGRPRPGQDPYPQQPDHDRRVPRLGHGPGSHGHGRNLQRPPAEGRGRSGQPAGLHRHQPLL